MKIDTIEKEKSAINKKVNETTKDNITAIMEEETVLEVTRAYESRLK